MTKQSEVSTTEASTEANDPTPRLSQSEQLKLYKERGNYEPYVVGDKQSIDNGDPVAKLLRGTSVSTIVRAAEKLKGLDSGSLATKYASLNRGSRRMNAGNVIRAFERRGDKTLAEITSVIKEANSEVMQAS